MAQGLIYHIPEAPHFNKFVDLVDQPSSGSKKRRFTGRAYRYHHFYTHCKSIAYLVFGNLNRKRIIDCPKTSTSSATGRKAASLLFSFPQHISIMVQT
jgi:hypothetical protein